MRKVLIVLLSLLLLFAVVACKQATDVNDRKDLPPELPPPPPPPAALGQQNAPNMTPPEPPTIEVPAKSVAEDSAVTEVFKGKGSVVELSHVRCNGEKSKLTFTIKNNGDREWQVNQEVPFPPPKEVGPLKLFLNNYEMNGLGKVYYAPTGERYFYSSDTFSDACGGVELLTPGEEMTCTVSPIPLASSETFQQKHTLFVSTPDGQTSFSFLC